jgi:curved DNA-binding protein CbpA
MEQDDAVSLIEDRTLNPDEIGLLASLITDEPDHYTVLGVSRNASNDDIQCAYCLAVEYFHPLKSRTITESDSVMHWKLSSAFLRIEEAFTVLSRRSRRKIYDDQLSGNPGRVLPVTQHYQSAIPRQLLQSEQSQESRIQLVATEIRTNERRRVERVPLNVPLRVSFDRHWQEVTETTDVSPLGIRFRLLRQIEPGSELRLEIPMPRDLRTHSHDDELYVVNAFVIYAINHQCGRQVVAEFV